MPTSAPSPSTSPDHQPATRRVLAGSPTRSALRIGVALAVLAPLVLIAPSAQAAPATPAATSTTSTGTSTTSTGTSTTSTEKPVPADVVPRIAWGSCGDDLAAFQCATVRVPRDYDHPRGAKISLALTRLPASDPKRRIGTLFTNPGGPGGSGVDFIQQSGQVAYPEAVRQRFDILGFDPRGVARSTPATCYPDQETETAASAGLLAFPRTTAEEREFVRESRAFARACATTSPSRFEHSSTADVARDMDLLRRAVGDAKLSYAGVSYGTFLGATYAKLFPHNIRALVLDGTVDPREWSGSNGDSGRLALGNRIEQDFGGSSVFAEFLRQCKTAGPQRCSLAQLGDPATVARQTFDALKKRPVTLTMDGQPIEITYQTAVLSSYLSLYSPVLWSQLADSLVALRQASAGASASTRVAAAPTSVAAFVRRGEDYPSAGGSLVSVCADSRQPDPRRYPAIADRADARFPDFGRARTWIDLPCVYLRQQGIRDTDAYRGPWQQTTAARVLVLGTRYDPATPYRNTRPYADLFRRAAVVTLEGWGHTTLGQSRCTDAITADYLLHPSRRRADARCATDLAPFTTPAPSTAKRAETVQAARQAASAQG